MTKCSKCGERDTYAKGLCKLCYTKQYNAEHREERRQYRTDHTIEIREYQKKYTEDHRTEKRIYDKLYYVEHRDGCLARSMRHSRANGTKPMSENRDCSMFLGVHVAERVLSRVFKDVQTMPMNHRGHDFICNRGKKIDVKSSTTLRHATRSNRWQFDIRRNTIADYFLCIAFNNRDELTPIHIWLIPGAMLSKNTAVSISTTRIDKWDEYRLDVDKVAS